MFRTPLRHYATDPLRACSTCHISKLACTRSCRSLQNRSAGWRTLLWGVLVARDSLRRAGHHDGRWRNVRLTLGTEPDSCRIHQYQCGALNARAWQRTPITVRNDASCFDSCGWRARNQFFGIPATAHRKNKIRCTRPATTGTPKDAARRWCE